MLHISILVTACGEANLGCSENDIDDNSSTKAVYNEREDILDIFLAMDALKEGEEKKYAKRKFYQEAEKVDDFHVKCLLKEKKKLEKEKSAVEIAENAVSEARKAMEEEKNKCKYRRRVNMITPNMTVITIGHKPRKVMEEKKNKCKYRRRVNIITPSMTIAGNRLRKALEVCEKKLEKCKNALEKARKNYSIAYELFKTYAKSDDENENLAIPEFISF